MKSTGSWLCLLTGLESHRSWSMKVLFASRKSVGTMGCWRISTSGCVHPFSGYTHHFMPTRLYKRSTVKRCSRKGNPLSRSFFLSSKFARALPMVVVRGHFIPSWPHHFQVGLEKSGILCWRWSSPARSCCNRIPLLWVVKWYWRNTHLPQLVWLRAWLRGTFNRVLKKYNITVYLHQREYILYNCVRAMLQVAMNKILLRSVFQRLTLEVWIYMFHRRV